MFEAARAVFGDRLGLAEVYAGRLTTTGVEHGLIGPREVPRLWDRHLLNCAVVSDVFPTGASVLDIGSGAGLPGLPIAIRRPDLRVVLVEPMQRRVQFLEQTVTALGLRDSVRIIRSRAPDVGAHLDPVDWVTARAVSPLPRLLEQCLPLLTIGGRLVALKGERAEDELIQAGATMTRLGGSDGRVRECGGDLLTDPTRVVLVRRGPGSTGRKRNTERGAR